MNTIFKIISYKITTLIYFIRVCYRYTCVRVARRYPFSHTQSSQISTDTCSCPGSFLSFKNIKGIRSDSRLPCVRICYVCVHCWVLCVCVSVCVNFMSCMSRSICMYKYVYVMYVQYVQCLSWVVVGANNKKRKCKWCASKYQSNLGFNRVVRLFPYGLH